ncbi:MAG: FHA domain-containing protein [Acidobacteria bacterium]|nr:FHA domain-containing protein [Acidobacteriota bacterium]
MPCLVYKIGDEEKTFELGKPVISIGRMEGNDLILFDPTISRKHCIIEKKEMGYFLKDLESRNGVFVNDQKVNEKLLKDGDEIRVGSFPLTYKEDTAKEVLISESEGRSDISEGTIMRSLKEVREMLKGELSGEDVAKAKTLELSRLQRNQKILASLSDVSRQLIEAVTYEEVLDKVMQIIKQAGKSEEAIRISHTIAKKAFDDKVAILCHDAQTDERFQAGASIRLLGIRSALCVPLIVEDKAIGLIYVDTPLRVKAYGDFELDLLSALSSLCAIAINQAGLRAKLEEEKMAKSRLERYHSPSVVKRILEATSQEPVLEARELNATVLFADLCGFTSMSENMEPKDVANFLNGFLSKMTDVIFEYEGTLDKFIGDCVMAIFGAPVSSEDHAERAIKCALDMRKALKEYNLENIGKKELNFRVGINSGKMVAGDIGSSRRMEYTVLGEVVNLASRLQSYVAKPGQIVIGQTTYNLTKGKFKTEEIRDVQVKGISKTLTAYEVFE